MANMRSIKEFYDEMAKFFEKTADALGPKDEAKDKEAEVPEEEKEKKKSPHLFAPPKELINTGGGGPLNPNPVIVD